MLRGACGLLLLAAQAGAAPVELPTDGTARRLAVIAGTLPASGLKLVITKSGAASEAAPGAAVTAAAGQKVDALSIVLTGGDTFGVTAARLRLVLSSVDDAAASSGACTAEATALGAGEVNDPFASATGASTTVSGDSLTLASVLDGTAGLVFRMGGGFGVCYSDDGTFTSGHADIMETVTINVAGVYDTCTTADCLAGTAYYCHALQGVATTAGSCALRYNGFSGNVGKVTWSEAWAATYSSDTGAQATLTKKACGTVADATVMTTGSGSEFVAPDAAQANKVVKLPSARALTSATQAYTLSACYCPDIGGCDAAAEYTQGVGALYFFVAKLCDPSVGGAACASAPGYIGATPAQTFQVLVNCPPGACAADAGSRVKLVDAAASNDLPSWDASQTCGTAVQAAMQSEPPNCQLPRQCASTPGSRQDWKLFGSDGAFRLLGGGSEYERRHFHAAKTLDMCFCLGSCTTATNWFKVGRAVLSSYRLLQTAAPRIGIVNVEGQLAFKRPSTTDDTIGLTGGSVAKLLLEGDSEFTDAKCRSEGFDVDLVGMPFSTFATSYKAQADASDGTQLIFNGGNSARAVQPTRAGIVAVCYCRLSTCAEISDDWLLALRTTLRGPNRGQSWTVSVGLPFRLSYSGYGLRDTDTIRIIPPSLTCDTSTNNPIAEESVQTGCPSACTQVDNSGGGTMAVAQKLLGYQSVDCDHTNANCKTVYLRRVTVLSGTTTELEFDAPPRLVTGDRVVLGSAVHCQSSCSDEQLAAVTGKHQLVTTGGTSTHDVANRVVATRDSSRFLIPVGWVGTVPTFSVTSMQGQWHRTSVATTAEELKVTDMKQSLKVCWSHNGNGNYVDTAGLLSAERPLTLALKLSVTTIAKDTIAPLIISFTTSDSSIYGTAKNSMVLKLIFIGLDALEPRYVDEEALRDDAERSLEAATQNMCGRLFAELWSDDAAGFPVPKGCYHRTLSATRELVIVFDAQKGLRARARYQLAFMGLPKSSSTVDVVQVRSMDDVMLAPYHTLEEGAAAMNKIVVPQATGASAQFMADQGVTVLDGANELVELADGAEINLRLRIAGDTTGKITKQLLMRLFMFPQTLWDMSYATSAQVCSVVCTPWGTAKCGAITGCELEAVVDTQQRNTIRFELPPEMDDITGQVQPIFRVSSVKLTGAGFAPTRLGAQVSSNTNAHYASSSGSLLWKRPAPGTGSAALVMREGDGNAKPFSRETQNVLHMQLRLGALLRRDAVQGVASLTITAPRGYILRAVRATPPDLAVFAALPESGRGALPPSRWVCAGAACSYPLQHGDALNAGSVLFVSLEVDNPPDPMPQSSPSNVWTMGLRSTGEAPVAQDLEAVTFGSLPAFAANFGANIAVLGRIREHCAQPDNFTAAASDNGVSVFFQPSQTVAGGGQVWVDAPEGFGFAEACTCENLGAAYYEVASEQPTRPLPSVVSCEASQLVAGSTGTRNRARIKVSGIIHAGRRYGFRLLVSNAAAYAAAHKSSWRLYTATSTGQLVDGTAEPLAFMPSDGGGLDGPSSAAESWGLYVRQLKEGGAPPPPSFVISSLQPYALTGQEATIKVLPLQVPEDVATSLRIIAPLGYEWRFSSSADFLYRSSGVEGATADLPGGVPRSRGGELTWLAAAYRAGQSYGFSTKIHVPGHDPRRSLNIFFVEFGYDDTGPRILAARVPGPTVQALSRAGVDYATSLGGSPNVLRFRVQTVTAIPHRGGLLLRGLAGFTFQDACRAAAPATAEAPLGRSLPRDVGCSFVAGAGGEAHVRLLAGETGIAPGFYEFELAAKNPTTTEGFGESEATPCGWTHCWTFHSLQVLADGLASPELDARATAPSFGMKRAMPYAGFPPLDAATSKALGRSDQPSVPSRLAFSFRLGVGFAEPGALTVRSPEGFVFAENCLADDGVLTSTVMFGASVSAALAASGSWEAGVPVLACSGGEQVAELSLGAGLRPGVTYLFLLKVASNPRRTLVRNAWSIETVHEASAPFDGFPLWSFTRVGVAPLSSARGASNLVNVTFRPHNSLDVDGLLVLSAPADFELAVPSTGACPVMLEERDPILAALSEKGALSAFSPSDLACRTESSATERLLILTLVAGRRLVPGRDYTVVVPVTNPASGGAAPSRWALRSFGDSSMSAGLDAVVLPGFDTHPSLATWAYTETAAFTQNGGSALEGLTLRLAFVEELRPGERLAISAPPGFNLADPANRPGETRCHRLAWGPEAAAAFTAGLSASCAGGSNMSVDVTAAVPAATALELRISMANPTTSPPKVVNYWHAEHRSAAGSLLSSGVFPGWRVIPFLEVSSVELVGEHSAGALGTLVVAFLPISAAASASVEAKAPQGFDFSQVTLTRPGQRLVEAFGSKVVISATITSGTVFRTALANVKMAATGGPTTFDVTTYAADGAVADRRIGYSGGFRLPGSIGVQGVVLESAFKADPVANPLKSLWPVRFDASATASMMLTFSNAATTAESLHIMGAPFEMVRPGFQITDGRGGRALAVVVVVVGSGKLQARLDEPLEAGREYHLTVGVVAPRQGTALGAPWSVYTLDGGALPKSRNSDIQTGFKLVGAMHLGVQASRSAPLTEAEVSVSIVTGAVRPTALSVAAPPGFVFPADCLFSGASVVTSCKPSGSAAGRPTARLTAVAGGFTGTFTGLKLRVTMPEATPASRAWFVEGIQGDTEAVLGWGEDPAGIEVVQMRDAGVVYAAVPGIDTPVAVRFRLSETIERGGQVTLQCPDDFALACNISSLFPMSLPGVVQCVVNSTSATLTVNGTLLPGEHAFVLRARTPSETPSPNNFSLLLRNRDGRLQDAATRLPGLALRPELQLSGASLARTSAEAGQASTVTIAFVVTQAIAAGRLGSLLITFPQNFEHAVEKDTSVVSKNANLSTDKASGSWVDISLVDRLSIRLDATQELPAGDYAFEFPVTVPEYIPAYNVWMVTFCGYSAAGVCQQHFSPLALVTFPLAGFDLQPLGAGALPGAAARMAPALSVAGMLPGLLGLLAPMLIAAPLAQRRL